MWQLIFGMGVREIVVGTIYYLPCLLVVSFCFWRVYVDSTAFVLLPQH